MNWSILDGAGDAARQLDNVGNAARQVDNVSDAAKVADDVGDAAHDVVKSGAKVLITEKDVEIDNDEVTIVRVKDTRYAMAFISAPIAWDGEPEPTCMKYTNPPIPASSPQIT